MTILRLRTLILRGPKPISESSGESGDPRTQQSKSTKGRNWAVVTLAAILVIAGLEGYALSRGIDGAALRAAVVSIGVLGGAGVGRVFK